MTPDWFEGGLSGAGRFDFQHLIQQPFSILKGGYMQYWDTATSSWQMVQAEHKPNARFAIYGTDYRAELRNKKIDARAKGVKLEASTAHTTN